METRQETWSGRKTEAEDPRRVTRLLLNDAVGQLELGCRGRRMETGWLFPTWMESMH